MMIVTVLYVKLVAKCTFASVVINLKEMIALKMLKHSQKLNSLLKKLAIL